MNILSLATSQFLTARLACWENDFPHTLQLKGFQSIFCRRVLHIPGVCDFLLFFRFNSCSHLHYVHSTQNHKLRRAK
ncbi:hypothetical protein T4D_11450 [Trichinella pseudospiralis]|uniref:Uncharacterized protein n=1 Tax=Trichinella pseudospiralis TaxID=6337 RepID=A0A0V1F4W9_TRIPS|nr:hypothetical protein T4D_11450 [Trichinella pseudospiralis]